MEEPRATQHPSGLSVKDRHIQICTLEMQTVGRIKTEHKYRPVTRCRACVECSEVVVYFKIRAFCQCGSQSALLTCVVVV